jgi:hypothetical protein
MAFGSLNMNTQKNFRYCADVKSPARAPSNSPEFENNTPDAGQLASSKCPVSSPSSGPEVTKEFMAQKVDPVTFGVEYQ